ncbi:MAG: amidase family protein [Magnetovibrio sp.]|nr:amidase family protein [Magnetovibrio sp.]
MTELCDLTAREARRRIGTKEISPVELLESCIARTEKVNPALNALVTECFQRARAEAKAAEAAVLAGEALGLLHGLPFAVKDLEATEGVRTTYGSLIYAENVPAADQVSVAAIRAEGAVMTGKTNTPEFGAGANTRNRVFGATGNPFDPTLTCAGSSGGSAVALAAGMVPIATGSDYGGSLRTPASFCGVVGFRPSPGTVPSEARAVGLNPFSVLGPMGRNVGDAAFLLAAMTSDDARDPFGGGIDPDLIEPLEPADPASLRVAISEDLGCAPMDDGIRAIFRERTKSFRHIFADAQDRDPELGETLHRAFEILRSVNFMAAHGERLANHRDKLGPNVISNTEMGDQFSAADVAWAHLEQTGIYRRFTAMFDEVDILISPAAAVSPFPHDQWYPEEINGEPLPNYMRWMSPAYALTMATPAACVIPFGVDGKGLPMGLQISGPNGSDRQVLEAALAIEDVLAQNPETARPLPDLAKLEAAA